MPSARSKALQELQSLARKKPSVMEAMTDIGKLEKEYVAKRDVDTGRSAILVATGLLEHALAVAISSKFSFTTERLDGLERKLFDGDHEREGVIGSLYKRNLLAHALDIYGPATYADINSIRVLRNLGAHAVHQIDFSSKAIQEICDFHSLNQLAAIFGASQIVPSDPVERALRFLYRIVPYFVLHGSTNWHQINRKEWRQFYS